MCGIAGILSDNHQNVSRQVLQQMTDVLAHRGPDGEGFWLNDKGTVGFGHRRLSIIDLSPAGNQPMHYLQRYTIVYNGEIYNYPELKTALQNNGYQFVSDSDTEVILAAYAHYGNSCLQYFDGMFAFAIWDEKQQHLFCARDRFGEKPFYFSDHHGRFVFASEIKALLAAGIDSGVHTGQLLNYLTLGLTADARNPFQTFYNNVTALPPAHFLELKFGNNKTSTYTINVQPYWDLDKETSVTLKPEQATGQFLDLLKTSVKRRLRSDVNIGTSLSGGLDSSTITALLHSMVSEQQNYSQAAFSAIFPGFEKDESREIKNITQAFNLKSFTITPTANGLINDFETLCWHQDEPFQSSSIYAQYKVYELAKAHGVTVLLDGQGADETLAGYHKYYKWYWQQLLAGGKRNQLAEERTKAESIGIKTQWNYKNYAAAWLPVLTAKQLQNRALRLRDSNADINLAYFQHGHKINPHKAVIEKLNDQLYYDTMQMGLQDLLRYADRNSMAHSREVRLPFLSHELVQFVFSLPAEYKIQNGFTKWLLRQSMSPFLPKEIAWRSDKVGFEPPQQQWMQSTTMQEYLHESRRLLVNKGVLNKNVLHKPLAPQAAHDAGNYDWRYLCAAKCLIQ